MFSHAFIIDQFQHQIGKRKIFERKEELEASKFVESLAVKLPVLDRGKFRVKVENSLNTDVWIKPNDGCLSTSLSLALWRLDKDPMCSFELGDRSDAGALTLSPPEGTGGRKFTHVMRSRLSND